jgi:ubiquitin carboxyl-terminal hydrolase 5/13
LKRRFSTTTADRLTPHNLQDGNVERAIEWLFSHPDDVGEEEVVTNETPSSNPQTASKIPGSDRLPANYRLKAFISHKGPSVHSGHYVATVRQPDGRWILYNDEKVVIAEGDANERMKSLAYLYIYERAD